MSRHSATKLTYEDYLQFPDDGLRHEIIEGEHYVTASPVLRHQRILLRFTYLLQSHLERWPAGELLFAPFTVLLSEFNVFEPDLLYISAARLHQLTEKNLQGAPDLVVEILSPSTQSRDRRLKREVYERTGVEEYWVVDPDENVIEVYRRSQPAGSGVQSFADAQRYLCGQILATSLLPGLELPLDKILA